MDLKIKKLDSSFIKIETDEESVLYDIYKSFSYCEPNFYRRPGTFWDGVTRLFNKSKKTLPYGLLFDLLELCKKRKWEFELDKEFKEDIVDVSKEEIFEWVKELDIRNEKNEKIENTADQNEEIDWRSILYYGEKEEKLSLRVAIEHHKEN